MKKILIAILFIMFTFSISSCGKNEQIGEPTNIMIEDGISKSLKNDAGIKFDRISDFVFTKVEVNESDMDVLKSKYASQVPFVKYESTFSLVSVEMDMKGNYSGIYVYNNGSWDFSFGYITDKDSWEYKEKEASRVDKQRMLADLSQYEFGSFNKGYVGNPRYSSIGSADRKYEETIHRDTINTSVHVKTDFAEYTIPVTLIYYFQQGEWNLGDIQISDVQDWELTYNNGVAPAFLSDSELLSYLTEESNFLTYICNLDYVSDCSIFKESEIASKESVSVNYVFSVKYDGIGTISYDVCPTYNWHNGDWDCDWNTGNEPHPPTVKDADFSEMLHKKWESDSGEYFLFDTAESTENNTFKLSGTYHGNSDSSIVVTLDVLLGNNRMDGWEGWNANISDINGNSIWDIPSSKLKLNLQYKVIEYNNQLFSASEMPNIEEPIESENPVNSSNVIKYTPGVMTYDNQVLRENLLVNDIYISYENESIIFTGNVSNKSEGQSKYTVSIVLYDKDDNSIGEGVASSIDSLLLPSSAAAIKISIPEISEEDYGMIEKIIVYVTSK